MKTNINIRKAGPDDTPTLSRLIRESFREVAERFGLTPENCPKHPSNCTDAWIVRDFKRGAVYFILECKGKPVGCVALEQASAELGYLERLAVLPEHRRQGFGKMLADQVITRSRDLGLKEIGIGIIAAQTDLKAWYKKLGFIAGETRTFKHLPFQVMFMKLAL